MKDILKLLLALLTFQWLSDMGCTCGGCFRLVMTIGVLLLCALLLL